MAVTRRNMVFAAGGVGLALAGTGGVFAVTRTPHRALKAWGDATSAQPTDVRLHAFRHAILAPNPHNRQPWLIRLVGVDQAVITCDLERRLPQTDPFDRQILIGFGCFLELARMAAAERGVRLEITPFPDGLPAERLDRRPIASLRFVVDPTVARDPVFPAFAIRRSAKQPFDTARPVPPDSLAGLIAQAVPGTRVAATRDDALVAVIRTQTWDAWMIEHQTQRTWQETVDLMRIGKSEIEANPDGVSIGGPFLEAVALVGQLSRAEMARPGSTAYKSGIDRYRPILASGMAYAWITTSGNTRLEQLAAGRAYVRMNLEAARQGLGFHPISQALQEFPEMATSLAQVQATLGAQVSERVQMLVRLGYGRVVAQTPRWPLESRLTGA
jgi:hypothetical protein